MSPVTCADCGCDESRGCVVDGWHVCRLVTDVNIPGVPSVLCSHCMTGRGIYDLRGGTMREAVVGLAMHGLSPRTSGEPALRDLAEKYGNPPEALRALAGLAQPCKHCIDAEQRRIEAQAWFGRPFTFDDHMAAVLAELLRR